jgi:hypothetical protein
MLTDDSIDSLKKLLKTMVYVQNLEINLAGIQGLTNLTMGSLREGIQAMIFLNRLKLIFYQSFDIDDDGLVCFQGCLRNLLALTDIELNF